MVDEKHSISRARQRPDNAVCPFWQRAAQGVQQQKRGHAQQKVAHLLRQRQGHKKHQRRHGPSRPQRPHLHAARPQAHRPGRHMHRACVRQHHAGHKNGDAGDEIVLARKGAGVKRQPHGPQGQRDAQRRPHRTQQCRAQKREYQV